MWAQHTHDGRSTSATLDAPGEAERSLALLETLFQGAPVGFAFVDREFRYVRLNDLLAAGHGAPAAEQIGKTVQEVLPLLWPTLEPFYRRALAGETVVNHDVLGASITGAPSHWLVSYYPVYQQGDVIGVGVIANDITERRRAEEALRVRDNLYAMLSRTNRAVCECRSREELFRDLCDIAVEVGQFRFAWVGVPDGNRVKLVASAGDDQGYMAEAVISLDEHDPRSHGPTGQAFVNQSSAVNDFMTSSATAPWHELARRVGFAASAAFPLKEHGRVVAVLTLYASTPGFFTDELLTTLHEITPSVSVALEAFVLQRGHQRDEAELRMLDRAIGAVSQGILITDPNLPDHPITYASPGFELLTGYVAGEVIGKNCRFLQGTGTDPTSAAEVREAIREGRACAVELLNYRKDGTPFWNHLAISPVRDTRGTVTNFVGVQTDVTVRRQLEAQLRQAQKMEAVGRLAGGVAHDFNNLLSVVLSYSEMILADLKKGDPIREDVEEIHRAGERAADLTRQLLVFSRQQAVETRVMVLNDVLLGMDKMLQRLVGEDVTLTTIFEASLGRVRVDPGSIEQLVMNLAINARDAMPMGGKLTMETANVVLDEQYVSTHLGAVPGPYVMLSVSDTGTGMDRATLAQIFEPFFTTKETGKGTGLGLSTVFGIVQQSGGNLWVYSEPGLRTTIKVYLPRVDAVAEESEKEREPTPVPGGEIILLVEDDAQVRHVARGILLKHGYVVLEASSAGDAILLSENHAGVIHLLLSDIVMPVMSGPAMAKRLVETRPEMRVLLMSGYTDDTAVRHGVIDASFSYLQKPLTVAALTKKVRGVLDSAGIRA